MTVLLSGATGFLGSALLKRFVHENIQVIALKRSSSDTEQIASFISDIVLYDIDTIALEDIFAEHMIDIVVHTATDYGNENESILPLISTNLLFTIELYECAQRYGVQCFVNTDTLLPCEVSSYALSKKHAREWLYFVSQKLRVINMKIEYMYGPTQRKDQFIPWLIEQMRENSPVIDLTEGTQKRDFVYIDDVVDAYMLVMQNCLSLEMYEEFEVGYGVARELRQIVVFLFETIKQQSNISSKLNFGAIAYRNGENMHMEADISKLNHLGWYPKVNMEEGLQRMVDM